jgi:hypothetical protein
MKRGEGSERITYTRYNNVDLLVLANTILHLGMAFKNHIRISTVI